MFNRSKQRPGFPKLPFFILRLVQVLCAVSVLGILAYFLYHLWKDGYTTPYEFSLLDFAAAATLLNFVVTSIFLCCCGLSSLYVVIFDGLLCLVWIIAFGLLVRAMGSSATESCSAENWGNSEGIRVCHLFKMLLAMSVIVIVSFLAMAIFAVVARRKQAMYKYEPALNPANTRAASTVYTGGAANLGQAHGYGHAQTHGTTSAPPAYVKEQQTYSPQHGAAYYN